MTTTNKSLAEPSFGALNWDAPLNANFGVIDAALGSTTTIDVTGVTATPVNLTAAQYQSLIIAFTGTLTANVTYRIPNSIGGQWILTNAATGAYTITFTNVAAATTVLVPPSITGVTVYANGTTSPSFIGNVYLTGGGGATGGGADQVFFENSQVVTTNYTITSGKNAMTAGPITINGGVVVTVPSGSVWTIV
jgi:hypothetical protein